MPINHESRSSGRKKKVLIEPFFPSSTTQSQPTEDIKIINTETPKTPLSSAPQIKSPEKKTPASRLGISLSALSEEKHELADNSSNSVSHNKENIRDESFTPIELLNQWKAYAEMLTEEHHLKNTMINCLPDLQDKDTFEVVVNNPVQEQRLLEHADNILSVLREKLKNSKIQMKVRVSVDNEKKLSFTALEKFNLMSEQNDTLKRLKDEFGLELL